MLDTKLELFLRLFKGVINSASMYDATHPAYKSAVADFFNAICAVLIDAKTLTLGFSRDEVFVNGEQVNMTNLLEDINHIFHFGMVKKIIFHSGITESEIKEFLSAVNAIRARENKGTRFDEILKAGSVVNVTVEMLDYSPLFAEGGEKIDDVWNYLLNAVSSDDKNNLSARMDMVFRDKALVKKFLNSDDAVSKFKNILAVSDNKQKTQALVGAMVNSAAKGRSVAPEDISKIAELLESVDMQALADSFIHDILTDDFDEYTFSFFNKLIEGRKESFVDAIGSGVSDKESRDVVANKLKILFSVEKDADQTDFYRKNLMKMLDEKKGFDFAAIDHTALVFGYEDILCELFYSEIKETRLTLVFDKLLQAIAQRIEANDIGLLTITSKIIKKRVNDNVFFSDARKRLSELVESYIVNAEQITDTSRLTEFMNDISLGPDDFRKYLIETKTVNPDMIKLFFKFYSEKSKLFVEMVKYRIKDVMFIDALINSLAMINDPVVCKVLLDIFAFSGDLIKIKIMKSLSMVDCVEQSFLESVVKSKNCHLRKEAVAVAMGDESILADILNLMFDRSDFFGLKNFVTNENIDIVAELKIRRAIPILEKLARDFMPWKRSIARKAKAAIERITDG